MWHAMSCPPISKCIHIFIRLLLAHTFKRAQRETNIDAWLKSNADVIFGFWPKYFFPSPLLHFHSFSCLFNTKISHLRSCCDYVLTYGQRWIELTSLILQPESKMNYGFRIQFVFVYVCGCLRFSSSSNDKMLRSMQQMTQSL